MRSLLFAILCLLFTAANDLLFKLFGRKKGAMGGFVMVVGLIGTIIALAGHPEMSHPALTLSWGLFVGFFSCTANLLLLPAMAMLPVGVGSTIYRLNMVGVILGGWLCFHEPVYPLQWCGIAAALVAVICFFPKQSGDSSSSLPDAAASRLRTGFILGIGAMLLRAFMGIAIKASANAGASADGVSMFTCFCWVVGGILWYLMAERKKQLPFLTKRSTIYAIFSGILVYLIVRCSTEMLSGDGRLTITLPLAQMSFVISFLAGILFLKEKCTRRMAAGALCGVVAVVLLALCSMK